MKKLRILVMMSLIVAFTACEKDKPLSISLDAEYAITLHIGAELVLKVVNVQPSNAHIEWESSNLKVASVDDNGKITANAVGETYISATIRNGSDWVSSLCVITVIKNDEETYLEAYIGKLTVNQNDGSVFEQENVEINIDIADDNTMKIIMNQVKFAEGMGIKLDMTIEGIETLETDSGLSISGDNIIPTAMNGIEFPQYIITEMEGEVTTQNITFSMMCGEFPLTFSGSVKSE